MEQLSLRILGVVGVILFLPLFLFTFSDPQLVEKAGKSFVEWKLQNELEKKIDSISLPKSTRLESLLGDRAKQLREESELKIENVKRQLKEDAPEILAEQIAQLRNLDCECRKFWEKAIRTSMQTKLISLETAKNKLKSFTNAKYMEIVERLTLDIRIFLGANAFVFLFLLFSSFVKPRAVKHLFLPGVLMLVSTIICSYFYLFEQNWFYTIIYNDYTGMAYIAYLSGVFGVLCDIAFNRARVTTQALNGVLQAFGHAASLVPC